VIVVSVQLDSAIHPSRDMELARLEIANRGDHPRKSYGNYTARTLHGRGKKMLDRRQTQLHTEIEDFPREAEHIWNLVAKALTQMGYGK